MHDGDSTTATKRVVSLVPSSTETLLALSADVVACTRFCAQPQLTHVGGTKNPDIAAIIALAPDMVVVDREENRLEDHDELEAAGLDLFVSDVRTLADGLDVVGALADAAGCERPPPGVLPAAGVESRRTAFVPIWRRPWMTVGPATYGGSLLDHIGIDLVAVSDSRDYPSVELAEVSGLDPDLVLIPSEPYAFSDDHLTEVRAAIPNAYVVRVDGQDLFWWGSRTAEAAGRLSRALERPPTR